MKNRIGASAIGVCLLSASLMVFSGSAAAASKVDATLRVVGANGRVLADQSLKTGTTSTKTSSKATCLGAGSKNGTITLTGSTALGLLIDGAKVNKALAPLAVSSDLGFGPGVCGIGGAANPPKNNYWALKINHKYSTKGGAEATLKNGDTALWVLASFLKPSLPGELFLKAQSSAKKNRKVKATVYSYDDKGKRTVVKGAKLKGVKAAATNGKGVTSFKLKKAVKITARLKGSITSNRVKVSVKG